MRSASGWRGAEQQTVGAGEAEELSRSSPCIDECRSIPGSDSQKLSGLASSLEDVAGALDVSCHRLILLLAHVALDPAVAVCMRGAGMVTTGG